MLDVGIFEIIIVALACLLIVGPERLPVVFKTLGILVGRAQNYVSKVKSDVEKELNFSEYEATEGELKDFGKKLAMHIAASNPRFIDIENVDQQTLDRERQVLSEQALESGKPKDVIDKMVDGRIKKFFDEIVLLEQLFILSDDKFKVKQENSKIEKELSTKITIKNFIRFSLGEGIEKEEKDFASEVAEAVK